MSVVQKETTTLHMILIFAEGVFLLLLCVLKLNVFPVFLCLCLFLADERGFSRGRAPGSGDPSQQPGLAPGV